MRLGTSLGEMLRSAGVKGAEPKMSVDQLRTIARPKEPEPYQPHLAMERLPQKFKTLGSVTEGEKFKVALLKLTLECGPEEITHHVIYGLIQLAHSHRDNKGLSGSRRKSMGIHVIPVLLRVKERIDGCSKRGCAPIRGILLEELERY